MLDWIKARVAVFRSRVTWPGVALLLWGAIQYIPDWKARWDFWAQVLGCASWIPPVIGNILNAVLTSPYFGLGLIVIGLTYLILVDALRNRRKSAVTGTAQLVLTPTGFRPPVPNWSIRDLFLYLYPGITEAPTTEWDKVGSDVLDKLATSALQAWGREIDRAGPPKFLPLAPIDKQYWTKAEFAYAFLMEGHELDLHASPKRRSNLPDYGDVQFSREQATAAWPGLYLSFPEAARVAWEQLVGSPYAKTISLAAKTPDKIIRTIMGAIFLSRPVYAQQLPSIHLTLIDPSEKSGMRVFDNGDVGPNSARTATHQNPRIWRPDLDAFITWARAAS